MKALKENIKIFFSSMISTFFVLVLLCGLATVEKNAKYIAFGDNSPLFMFKYNGLKPIYIKIHFMGKDYVLINNNSN